jgi:isopentenyl-diphosphate delta-isomerase
MSENSLLSSRKADHIRINLEQDVQSARHTGLEQIHFIHQALPEINLNDVDLSQVLFKRQLKAPLLISSMTGGTPEAARINQTLAEAAQHTGIALGLGSQRAGIEHAELAYTFQVRKVAPDILLFANIGAVQLNYSYTVEQCLRAVEMVEADALILHINPLQEALQPEGDVCFAGLLPKIEAVCKRLPVPVIAKEVGWGISREAARALANAGVSAIDVAGAGGTSWSQVEKYRIQDENLASVAGAFVDWGIPTAQSILEVHQGAPGIPIIASGGLVNGVDVAKCIALGAVVGGMAGTFLKPATISLEATLNKVNEICRTIQVVMFSTGASNLTALRKVRLIGIPDGDER